MSTETTVPAAPTAAVEPAPQEISPGRAAPPQCARCGSTDLGRGYLLADRPKFRPLRFVTRGLPLWRMRRLFRVDRFTFEVECQVCRDCGHLMLSVDTEKLRNIEKKHPA